MEQKLKKFIFGQNKRNGFSLIEVLATISIILILSLLVLPNLKSFIQQQRLNHLSRVWLTRIRLTRFRALKTKKPQTLAWKETEGVTLNFKSSFGRNKQLVFLPNGFTQGQQGSLYICLKNNPEDCRRLIILASGVVRWH